MADAKATRVDRAIATALLDANLAFTSGIQRVEGHTTRLWNLAFAPPSENSSPLHVVLYGTVNLLVVASCLQVRADANQAFFDVARHLAQTVPFVRALPSPAPDTELWVRAEFPIDANDAQPVPSFLVDVALQSVTFAAVSVVETLGHLVSPVRSTNVPLVLWEPAQPPNPT